MAPVEGSALSLEPESSKRKWAFEKWWRPRAELAHGEQQGRVPERVRKRYQKELNKALAQTLQRLVPSLTMDDIRPGRAGVRALLLSRDGDTRDDFRIESTDRSIHVLNAPSPAATASLAIGDYVADRFQERFG